MLVINILLTIDQVPYTVTIGEDATAAAGGCGTCLIH